MPGQSSNPTPNPTPGVDRAVTIVYPKTIMSTPIRFDLPNLYYHLFARGNNKQRIFLDRRDFTRFLRKLRGYKEDFKFRLHAYVLMETHFHLLIQPLKTGIVKIMQPLMTAYTKYFSLRHNLRGHVFESRYQSIIVDKDEYLLSVSRYIHQNPVRAGIVTKPQDYSWSSYKAFIEPEEERLVDQEETLGMFSQDKNKAKALYQEFVEEVEVLNPLKDQVRGVLGEDKFRQYLIRSLGVRI